MTATDWIQAVSAAAVALLTLFLWLLARRQTQLLASSVKIAQASAEAAMRSAEIAERVMVGVQRPLLKVDFGSLRVLPPRKNIDVQEARVEITLINIGREPTIIVDSAIQLLPCLGNFEVPKPGVRPYDAIWSMDGPDEDVLVRAEESTVFEINRFLNAEAGETIENFKGTRGRLIVYGTVIYDDLLGIRRECGFTYMWKSDVDKFVRCGIDGHNYDRIIDADANPIVYQGLQTSDPA